MIFDTLELTAPSSWTPSNSLPNSWCIGDHVIVRIGSLLYLQRVQLRIGILARTMTVADWIRVGENTIGHSEIGEETSERRLVGYHGRDGRECTQRGSMPFVSEYARDEFDDYHFDWTKGIFSVGRFKIYGLFSGIHFCTFRRCGLSFELSSGGGFLNHSALHKLCLHRSYPSK